ncbi:MAG: hypothetical protein LLF76_11645 [Planctomycetaceae bacterium]|nr:hypothetical protein [Planctomycetaceae bacterium]
MKKLAILMTMMFVASFFMVSSAQAEGTCCKAKQQQAQCPNAPADADGQKQCPKAGEKKECPKECPKDAQGQGKCEKAENPQ